MRQWKAALAAGLPTVLIGAMSVLGTPAAAQSTPDLFEQVWQTVDDRFFDPDFNGVDWVALREAYRPLALEAGTRADQAAVINAMLDELQTSHTRLFTPDEPAYYQLLGVFLPGNDSLAEDLRRAGREASTQYTGIGLFTETIGDKVFVRGVIDGGPAALAGVMTGDEVLAVDGQPFHPIASFAGRAGEPVVLSLRRTADAAVPTEITVTPTILDGAGMFLDAMRASVTLVEQDDRQIGYIRIWSYAGSQYQDELETTLLFGALKDADALVLDLRDGWGGAWPGYLNLFTDRTIGFASIGRDGQSVAYASGWDRPVVLLVDGQTRSGKELLAYGFREHDIGPVVGSRTAGAVVAGSVSVMDDGSLLYVAVRDVLVDGDVRLEGVGVSPDIDVPFTLEYAAGADPRRDRAVAVALEAATETAP